MKDAALWYHRHMGYSLIPVIIGAGRKKKPPFEWAPFQTRKPTEQEIIAWWTQYPNAGIGIITGKTNNLSVIDLDYCEMGNGTREQVEALFPDSMVTPSVTTPRGGCHFWFSYHPDIPNASGLGGLKGFDSRNDGGFIMAPPSPAPPDPDSVYDKYTWKEGLEVHKIKTQEIPYTILEYIKASTVPKHNRAQQSTTEHLTFTEPGRDQSLFHIAWSLLRGRMPEEEIQEIIEFIASHCNPPFPEKEAWEKVKSALLRKDRKEKSIAEEVREWVQSTSGHFLSTEYHREAQVSTKEDKHAVSMALQRLAKEGIIEKYGDRRGSYRLVDNDCPDVDWFNASGEEFPIALPFQIDRLIRVFPKSVIVIAGEPDAGKTALLMNLVRDNMRKQEIWYFSSEMGGDEFNDRLKGFEPETPRSDFVKTLHFKERAANLPDVIQPKRLNIIDFLEIHDNFYQIGGMIKGIFDKLTTGVAVIALQKNPKSNVGLGGIRSLEKPRLYLTLSQDPPAGNIIHIEKAKNWRHSDDNPNHKQLRFKLVGGCRIIPTTSWEYCYGKN